METGHLGPGWKTNRKVTFDPSACIFLLKTLSSGLESSFFSPVAHSSHLLLVYPSWALFPSLIHFLQSEQNEAAGVKSSVLSPTAWLPILAVLTPRCALRQEPCGLTAET